ncbi:MAG: S-layer homology domain-containing protein, partial [Clostridia bacterium]|nr:S-layer homology domain-containing protein [Clostridia bacterium]
MRPAGLAVDDKSNLYIADTDAGTIRMMDKNGKVTTYYAGLNEPTGICYSDGVLYICETGANRIVSIKGGSLSVVAGGEEGFADGSTTSAKFAAPLGIAVASDGTIIVSDTGNSAVRKIVGGRVYTLITSDDKDSNVVAPRGIYVTGPYAIITDNYSGELVVKSFESTSLFSDVADSIWYADAVNKAAEIRLVSGTGNGKFAPNLNFSRGELVTILSKIELLKDRDLIINGTSTFPDVAPNAFYAKAVGWAAENGLVAGNQNGYFMPADNITRQDLATLLYKYAVKKNLTAGVSADLRKFKDSNEVLDYAKSAINWAVGIGIISGSNGMLNPRATATRAEAIKLIMNFVEYYNL